MTHPLPRLWAASIPQTQHLRIEGRGQAAGLCWQGAHGGAPTGRVATWRGEEAGRKCAKMGGWFPRPTFLYFSNVLEFAQ